MPLSQRLGLSGIDQLLPRELPDGLEHPIATSCRVVDQQRLVDQGGDQYQDIQVVLGADLLGSLQREISSEH